MKSLLIHNVDLFSKDDRDFERTDIVKYSINNGSRAQPLPKGLRIIDGGDEF